LKRRDWRKRPRSRNSVSRDCNPLLWSLDGNFLGNYNYE